MLLALLLDTVERGIPFSSYVAIGAAVLAALASINATRVSSKTTRAVAAQAAQTARDSAKIAADTAREIKNQDYKFDFYKKIIEKRLSAWTDAEQSIISTLATTYTDEFDNRTRFRFFAGPERFALLLETVNKFVVQQAFWIGGDYARALVKLRDRLAIIANQCLISGQYNANGTPLCDADKLYEAGAIAHKDIAAIFLSMAAALNRQMLELHEVEQFLVNRVGELA